MRRRQLKRSGNRMSRTGGPERIVAALAANKVEVVVSVPDTWLVNLLELISEDKRFIHVPAAREEEGLSICCGASLGGKRAALVVQNAGLFTTGAVLAALAEMYGIPFLLLVSNRGTYDDPIAFPVNKGLHMRQFVEAMGLVHADARAPDKVEKQITEAVKGVEVAER